jgi:predicted MFS family arabinose efflux permease
MSFSSEVRQYAIVTGNYWAFTLTDGALRMLVLLHFHQLGYSPLAIASLFLFYEIFGVITNLFGGWLGARIGLNKTMNIGLGLQILALGMLLVPADFLTVIWVMCAQALSGIAKDLNKMSAKSSIKLLVNDHAKNTLYRWVALLTGSKNALKGVGFFLGGALLQAIGFQLTILSMVIVLGIVWLLSLVFLQQNLGKASFKAKFRDLFSKSAAINRLSAARLFLFAARDVWFVVALPIYLSQTLGWDFWTIGGFMALWVIGYGIIQALAPMITQNNNRESIQRQSTEGSKVFGWGITLALITALIATGMMIQSDNAFILIIGLLIFGALFAINSALHSYLVVQLASADGVSLDVGFYYMANAMGRLLGTVLSGWIFQAAGLEMCLWISALLIFAAAIIAKPLKN